MSRSFPLTRANLPLDHHRGLHLLFLGRGKRHSLLESTLLQLCNHETILEDLLSLLSRRSVVIEPTFAWFYEFVQRWWPRPLSLRRCHCDLSASHHFYLEASSDASVSIGGGNVYGFALHVLAEILLRSAVEVLRHRGVEVGPCNLLRGLAAPAWLPFCGPRPHLVPLVEVDLGKLLESLWRCVLAVFVLKGPQLRDLSDFFRQKILKLKKLPEQIHVFVLSQHVLLQMGVLAEDQLDDGGEQKVVIDRSGLCLCLAPSLRLGCLLPIVELPKERARLLFSVCIVLQIHVVHS